MENDTAPLAYIEIAVKAGAIAQTKETAGLFHLFEHMMFKGNSRYQTAAEVQSVINNLGVPSWNGSTGVDFVNYYFTVPSNLLESGLDFWSSAIREPLLDRAEFENEKKVVLAEITGSLSDPDQMYRSAYLKELFPDNPWRLDPSGSLQSIQNATIEQLHEIKNQYYVPNNTALFIGGNVKNKDVYTLVRRIFGSWAKGDDPWIAEREIATQNPLQDHVYQLIPMAKVSPHLTQVSVFLRGPDTAVDINSTYSADVLTSLLENPAGKYKTKLLEDDLLKIPDANSISSYYATYKESGIFNFSATMLKPEEDLVYRTNHFVSQILENFFYDIIEDEEFFPKENFDQIKQRIEDYQLYESETAEGFLKSLRFWWASASTDYFFSYISNIKKTLPKNIKTLVETYILEKPLLVTVLVNPDVYEKVVSDFTNAGYNVVTPKNAFWFNK
ncbi:MAG: M16 family metallopeptidase [Treponemataceae bacterium]